MGVRQHNLILIGSDIGSKYYDTSEWDKEDCLYEKYELNRKSKSGDMVLLSDNYSGKYFIAGKLVRVDYDAESGFGTFIPDTESEEFQQGKKEVIDFIKEIYSLDVDPTYIVMTYYT
ncbi:hypothetical protein A616_16515 [Brevibacillus brevis X23]|nr:hypothetical protein A616_16515 [Brevibacillus brevis X23]